MDRIRIGYPAGYLGCSVVVLSAYVCCRLIVYFMGGQLVFDWDRLENVLITRDRPASNIVTNTKCQI